MGNSCKNGKFRTMDYRRLPIMWQEYPNIMNILSLDFSSQGVKFASSKKGK